MISLFIYFLRENTKKSYKKGHIIFIGYLGKKKKNIEWMHLKIITIIFDCFLEGSQQFWCWLFIFISTGLKTTQHWMGVWMACQ